LTALTVLESVQRGLVDLDELLAEFVAARTALPFRELFDERIGRPLGLGKRGCAARRPMARTARSATSRYWYASCWRLR
jgi:CubicO group peptidase (beta-lactamase class C family)